MNSGEGNLHYSSIVIDCHADTPDRIVDNGADVGRGGSLTHVDVPKMRQGGRDAVFFSAWIRPNLIPKRECIQRV